MNNNRSYILLIVIVALATTTTTFVNAKTSIFKPSDLKFKDFDRKDRLIKSQKICGKKVEKSN